MGGWGSDSWYRWNRRTTCEETKRIDIRYLKQRGLLKPGTTGSLSWSVGSEPSGSISYTMSSNQMRLDFRARGPDPDGLAAPGGQSER